MFADRLINRIISMKNHCIVGIDPSYYIIPEFLKKKYLGRNGGNIDNLIEMIYEFCINIIDSVYDIVPAIKPQIAFFEKYGSKGLMVLEEICKHAKKKELLIIADIKRGDIRSTCDAYADYYFGNDEWSLSCDAVTINPYMGSDSIISFLEKSFGGDKGIFILVKTSNKSSIEIQNLISEGKKVYEHVADLVINLGKDYVGQRGYSSVGTVIGGTYKEEGENLRKRLKNCYFLVPGYGAQGAVASDLSGYFNQDGLGAIINSSRGIIGAYQLEKYRNDFDQMSYGAAARKAVLDMRNEINMYLELNGKLAW